MNSAEFATRIKGAKPPANHGGWWSGNCPAHNDQTASLSFKDGDRGLIVKCHAGAECSPEQIAQAVGVTLADFFFTKPRKPPKPAFSKSLTIEALAQAKGFDPEFLKGLGVEQHGDSVKIVYRLMDGTAAPRHQLRHASGARFTWTTGPGEIAPYGLDHVAAAGTAGYVFIVALLQQAQDLRIAAAEDGRPTEDFADHVATLAWDVEQLDRRYLRPASQ